MAEGSAGAPAVVVIVGGGVAALETLIALRHLAGERVRITLVAPQPKFVHRPMSVAEPFGYGAPARHPLAEIARDFDAEFVEAGVHAVDPDEHRVGLRSGATLRYDTLVLAPGARMLPAFEQGVMFSGPASASALRALVEELASGAARSAAFVAPSAQGWTLPVYELALLTARHAPSAAVALVTPEPRPLDVFGPAASAEVAKLLSAAGITFHAETYVDAFADEHLRLAGGATLPAERLVALPLLRGPGVAGVPAGDLGFIPADEHGRVPGLEAVYAAGDATDRPVKQGGLAAQQADAVAAHVAARHGAPVDPAPYRPVLRGMLFTGGADRFLRSTGDVQASPQALWWPPTKIAGAHLAPYLYARDQGAEPGPAPPGFTDLEVTLAEHEEDRS